MSNVSLKKGTILIQLTVSVSLFGMMWQCWSNPLPPFPHMTQRIFPQKVSRSLIPVLNEVSVDKLPGSRSRSDHPYPGGGAPEARGSSKVVGDGMMNRQSRSSLASCP